MSILGVIVRVRPEHLPATEQALRELPGTDLALPVGAADGRLVVVIEDTEQRAAASLMAEIALWPQVLNTSLVYEYSGPDVPGAPEAVTQYTDWRASLKSLAGPQAGTPATP
ncbi:MAG: chaperone NapD [Burkholderiaceae bacterium]|nr:chaperone NapD [Burkholderiaceae bacterium]